MGARRKHLALEAAGIRRSGTYIEGAHAQVASNEVDVVLEVVVALADFTAVEGEGLSV